MEKSQLKSIERKKKRILRIRKKIKGTTERPRLCVTKTNKQLSVQLIDDLNGATLVSGTTLSKEIKMNPSCESAKVLGELIASLCGKKGIKMAVLDRRGNKYHGMIAKLADTVRENGLQI